MNKVARYLGKYKLRLSIGLTIKIIGTLCDLALPYILAYIVDDIIKKSAVIGDREIRLIIMFGALMVGCALAGFIFNVIANRMAASVSMFVTRNLRHDLFEKIESLSAAQTDEVSIPSLVSRMSTDTYNVHQMVGMMQRLGVRAPILLIGGIVVTLTLDPILTLVLLATLPFVVVLVYLVSKVGIPLFKHVQVAVDDMVRVIRENASGIRVIKALSKSDYEKERFQKVNKKVIDCELNATVTMAKLNPMINLILNIGLVIVIVVGGYRVNNGDIETGKILAFTSYFIMILNATLSITRLFTIYSRASASATRIKYVFDLPEDLVVVNGSDELTDNKYLIEFKNVNFSYNKVEENLSNINFKLKKGESLGIIGSTGSGKTTLINLLMRFYDVDSGEILFDGKNIKEYEHSDLKKKFGVVFQNDVLFSNTIHSNISFGRGLDDEKVRRGAKSAQAEDFIMKQEDGFEHVLAIRGQNLSGGQKQRLLIARALANNPEVIILDDSSSALDYKTDAALRKEIKENFGSSTQIIVAQRISSIMNCDYIMLLEDGKIVDYGTHAELYNSSQIYKEISVSQMGGAGNEF